MKVLVVVPALTHLYSCHCNASVLCSMLLLLHSRLYISPCDTVVYFLRDLYNVFSLISTLSDLEIKAMLLEMDGSLMKVPSLLQTDMREL